MQDQRRVQPEEPLAVMVDLDNPIEYFIPRRGGLEVGRVVELLPGEVTVRRYLMHADLSRRLRSIQELY